MRTRASARERAAGELSIWSCPCDGPAQARRWLSGETCTEREAVGIEYSDAYYWRDTRYMAEES